MQACVDGASQCVCDRWSQTSCRRMHGDEAASEYAIILVLQCRLLYSDRLHVSGDSGAGAKPAPAPVRAAIHVEPVAES